MSFYISMEGKKKKKKVVGKKKKNSKETKETVSSKGLKALNIALEKKKKSDTS